jgi:hypothetical protein
MVTHLAEERFAGRAAFPLGAGGLDRASLAAALAESVAAGASTLVFTTTLAAASLLETGLTAELPPGSVLLTTGGAKGRRGGVDPAAVEVELGRRLGGLVVGAEYGMTELSSQAYRVGPRPFRLPAWCRVLAIDPATGRRRPHGTRGLLRFIDLANAHSAVAVQTADQGATHSDHTFTLLGRAVGAPLRGCSLSFEEIAGGAP